MMYVALCAIGAEHILGNELKLLGYRLSKNAPGRVVFEGDSDALYRANYCLRTADRVYLLLAEFSAQDFDELFEGCYAVDWQNYFKKDVRLVVDKVRSHKSALHSERTVQSVVQKAAYKKLGDVWRINTLPESGAQCDVRVYIESDKVQVLLDTSGQALHKRGYRTEGGIAPLRETTAAVLLQEMLWRRKTPLHDPFCGSGTIVTEAVLYAHNVAPGLSRNFGYENLSIYNAARALEIKKIEAEKIRTDVECRISGSDIDPAAIERARHNAEHACVVAGRALQLIGSDNKVQRPDFIVSNFTELKAPYEKGLILCNPPYGERIGDFDLAQKIYTDMASLFEDFPGWHIGVITCHKKFQDYVGHYADLLKNIKAGNLDTTLYIYNGKNEEMRQKKLARNSEI